MYDTVLVPTDGSDAAADGVAHALDLAAEHDATVHVLSVVTTGEGATAVGNPGAFAAAVQTTSERTTETVAEEARERGLDVERTVETGTPSRIIVDYARTHDIDVVVMGTHGRTGLAHVLTGSVTERVIRSSDAPVLAVRARA
ncbi:universal stress protein [Halarchaeum salinum]|uniref:Universal stress protein n=1 Tax=Halarchaeum salinum TaxID=489912 RepID=A0AAV3SB62_9EURY